MQQTKKVNLGMERGGGGGWRDAGMGGVKGGKDIDGG